LRLCGEELSFSGFLSCSTSSGLTGRFFLVPASSPSLLQALQGDADIFSRVLTGLFDTAKTGFEISLGLTGVMSLWLGLMKIGERGGIIQLFGRALGPFFRRIFPDIPPGHPAGGSIVMNFSANLLGLDNAATPLGLKAMRELQEINPQEGHGEQPDDHVPGAQHRRHHADPDLGDRHPPEPRRSSRAWSASTRRTSSCRRCSAPSSRSAPA
jgi:hypothetical protein